MADGTAAGIKKRRISPQAPTPNKNILLDSLNSTILSHVENFKCEMAVSIWPFLLTELIRIAMIWYWLSS